MIDLTKESLVSMKQAAARLGKHKKTVYEWAKPTRRDGAAKQFWLETIRLGGSLMTSLEALQRYADRCSQRREVVAQVAMTIAPHVSDERIRRARENMRASHGNGRWRNN